MPLIDILMPVRNAAPYLTEAVGSITAQSFTNWRLIAVDDRSTDNSWPMLCAWSKSDERIWPLKSEGRGLVRALNTALTHSRAPYIARMDADDISESTRLEKLLRLLDGENYASVAGSRLAVFPPEAVSPNMRRYIEWQNSLLTHDQIRVERYVESTLTHATAMFRRDILVGAGAWREGPFPEDLDLWLRMHRAGVRFTKHPEVLYLWREHGKRETRNSRRCTPEAFHRCKVMHLTEELAERNISSLVVLGPERACRRWTKSLAENGFDNSSFTWKPGSPLPEQVKKADLLLAAFGVPNVRVNVRQELRELGEEEEKWLFVG